MKKTLGFICAAIECLLFLWLAVGLWACANKIKELEMEQEYIRAFNASDAQTKSMVMALNSMQHDTDMLRLRVEELENVISVFTNRMNEVAVKERHQPLIDRDNPTE